MLTHVKILSISVPHIKTFLRCVTRNYTLNSSSKKLYLVSLMCWITRCYHHIVMINACLMITMNMFVPGLPMFPHWDCGTLHTCMYHVTISHLLPIHYYQPIEYTRFIEVNDKPEQSCCLVTCMSSLNRYSIVIDR